jgi:hypothetical protein
MSAALYAAFCRSPGVRFPRTTQRITTREGAIEAGTSSWAMGSDGSLR